MPQRLGVRASVARQHPTVKMRLFGGASVLALSLVATVVGTAVLPSETLAQAGCNSGNKNDAKTLDTANCQASADGVGSTAVGAGATANAPSSNAFGAFANAGAQYATAIGGSSDAGVAAVATGFQALAVGTGSELAGHAVRRRRRG